MSLSAGEPESVFTTRYDTLEAKLEAFHAELAEATAALADDENWNHYLATMARFHRYSMTNQILIALQRPNATYVAGYRKWQELGRQVCKGQKSIQILAPKTVRAERTDAGGKPVLDASGKPVRDVKVVGFTTASVFDVSQTDGEPLPEMDRSLSEEPPEGFVEDLEAAVEHAGYSVSYEPVPGSTEGFTEPSTKRVVVDSSLSPGSRASVLAHELGHIAAGHVDETEHYHTGAGGQRGAMEVEAESIAHVLCRSAGMTTPATTSAPYVAGWAQTAAAPDVVAASAKKVSSTVKGLLSTGRWRHLEEEA